MRFAICFLGFLAVALAIPPPQAKDLALPVQKAKIPIKFSDELISEFMIKMEKPLKGSLGDSGELTAILNNFADKIFGNIKNFMIHASLDPFSMPDIHEGFNYTLIITYHGELDMTNGWLQDVSSMHRGGDVRVTYDAGASKRLQVVVPITFDDLAFDYDYSAKIMGLGPTGGVEGKISKLAVEVAIGFDFENYVASLDEFYILNSGHVDLNFSGNILIDWLLNLLIDVASAALHRIILLIMESIVRNPLQSIVDLINELLANILHPTTPVPITSTVAASFF